MRDWRGDRSHLDPALLVHGRGKRAVRDEEDEYEQTDNAASERACGNGAHPRGIAAASPRDDATNEESGREDDQSVGAYEESNADNEYRENTRREQPLGLLHRYSPFVYPQHNQSSFTSEIGTVQEATLVPELFRKQAARSAT